MRLENRRATLFVIDITAVTFVMMFMSFIFYGSIKSILVVAAFFLLQGVSLAGLYHPCTNNGKIVKELLLGLLVSLIPVYIVLYVYQIVVEKGNIPVDSIDMMLSLVMLIALAISTLSLISKNKTLTDFCEAMLLIAVVSFCAFFLDVKLIEIILQKGFSGLVVQDFTIFKVVFLALVQSYVVILLLRNIYQIALSFKGHKYAFLGDKSALDDCLKDSFWKLPASEYNFIGIISPSDKTIDKQNNQLGHISNLIPIIKANHISMLVVTDMNLLSQDHLYALYLLDVELIYSLDLIETVLQKIPIEYVTSEWIGKNIKEGNRLFYSYNKRLMDVIISWVIILVTLPVTVSIWILNLLTSPGPLFYKQARVGQGGKNFDMYKFRSMVVNAEKHSLGFLGAANDPRVTFAGKMIRPLRLDEIPQMINILGGTLTLVGPRPDIVSTVDQLKDIIPFHPLRRIMIQGWTGWAQVRAGHADTLEDNRYKFEYDLYYLKHRCIYLDFHILFRAWYVVFLKGMY